MTIPIPDRPIKKFPGYPKAWSTDVLDAQFRRLLGEFETPCVPLDLEVIERTMLDDEIVRERVTYAVDVHERVAAYHLYKKDLPSDAPGILSIHGHGGEQIFPHGKAYHCHPRRDDPIQYSYHAARSGFRVLAPDALCFGERRAQWGYSTFFFDEVAAHAELTSQGKSLGWKSVWDNSRAIEALEFLGSPKIGIMGWSGGSIQSYLLAPVNHKVQAAVCFFSFITLRHQFGQYRCAHCLYPYIPGMMEAGIDWDQVVSLIAPRKLFLGWGALDEGTPEIMYRSFISAIESRTTKESLPPSVFTHEEPSFGHEITRPMLKSALQFLKDSLAVSPGKYAPPIRKTCGFTLVELLVVITIIAILIALIFPLAKTMQNSAENAGCISNLQTVAQAMLMYAADHDGRLPPFYSDANRPAETHWQYIIGTQYLNESPDTFGSSGDVTRSVLRCPADHTLSHLSSPPRKVRSMAINGSAYPGSDYGYPPWPLPRGVTNRKLNSIQYPAQLCMLADGASGEFSNEWGYAARLSSIGTPTAPLSWFLRHRRGNQLGMHCAMVDGHVEWHSAEWIQNEHERDHNHYDSIFFDTRASF